ncbi:hypothetical protein JEZ13_06970 [bacterium]|nr:hypothetical protein [bacterium]
MLNHYSGRVKAPASKSCCLRALICSLLTEDKHNITISNISLCDDVLSGIKLISKIESFSYIIEDKNIIFTNNNDQNQEKAGNNFDVGESGFLARVFVSLGSYFYPDFNLRGKGTLLKRDLAIEEFAKKVGLFASSSFIPATIQGAVKPGNFTISENNSSQFLSGLLFLLPLLNEDSIIHIESIVSKPYIDLTLSYLKRSGIQFDWISKNELEIPGNQKYCVNNLTPESDWSSLSYLIVLGILAGDVVITDIIDSPALPDRVILDLLNEVGGDYSFLDKKTLQVKKSQIRGFTFDLTPNPDLAPVLVALALSATSPSLLKGCHRLRNKESDRLLSIINMLKTLNVKYTYQDDVLTIIPRKIMGGVIRTYGDHRIAMTALILNSISENKITIDNYECINKSYPEFLDDLKKLGAEK